MSLLQRELGIGYGRAARLVDYMAEDGIVGNYNGSQAREVLLTLEQWAEMNGEAKSAVPVASPPRANRILTVANRAAPRIDDEDDDEYESDELDHKTDEDEDQLSDPELEDDDDESKDFEESEDDEDSDLESDEDELDDELDEQNRSPRPRHRRGRESA